MQDGGTHRAGVAAGCCWSGLCYLGTAWWGNISPRMGRCSSGGVLEKVSVPTELHRVCPDSLEERFKVSFPAWCRCS